MPHHYAVIAYRKGAPVEEPRSLFSDELDDAANFIADLITESRDYDFILTIDGMPQERVSPFQDHELFCLFPSLRLRAAELLLKRAVARYEQPVSGTTQREAA